MTGRLIGRPRREASGISSPPDSAPTRSSGRMLLGCNRDDGFERLVLFLQRTLGDPLVFDAAASQEIDDDLALISDPETPADDAPFDRLVEWCRKHPEPVAHPHDPDLLR
ncbi:hypothetical protein ACIBL6_19375 [Streptomyces sp. NPDC050400]|uniref:hypothetical protein n=1 Tax=Streptomyces sp. NPDC050400 TaxID=3365610 RepID=UPI0037917E8B